MLAVGLPFSRALISIAPGVLGGYWIFDVIYRRDFYLKLQRLKANKTALLFIGFFLLYILGGLYSEDSGQAIKIITNKIPWLVLPLIIATSKPMPARHWKNVLLVHIAAVVASSICSYINLHGIEAWANPKSAILFVNHIRLSLMLVLAVASLAFLAAREASYWKIITLCIGLWALFFMSTFEIATGVAVFLVLLLCLGIYAIRFEGLPRIAGIVTFFISMGALAYVSSVAAKQFLKPSENIAVGVEQTSNGASYKADYSNNLTENGYYVWRYLALDEMRSAWTKRSDRKVNPDSHQDRIFEGGLIRYLTSLGLRKDAEGVSALSIEDIAAIEAGHPSVTYSQYDGIRKRLYMLFYEVDDYLNGGDPSLSSLTIKWEYWRTGIQLIKEKPLFGVGTGDVRAAFKTKQELEGRIRPDSYDKAHNQFITWWVTFGIIGGCWALYAFMAPLFHRRSQHSRVMPLVIYTIFLLSFLTEDTLENQLGLNLFLFYASLFIIPGPQDSLSTSS